MTVSAETAVLNNDNTILVSFEPSQSRWVLTIRLPGSERMYRHSLKAGDTAAVAERMGRERANAEQRSNQRVDMVTIYEPGLDGFWLHRWLSDQGIESHVVDAASIAHLGASATPTPTASMVRPCSPSVPMKVMQFTLDSLPLRGRKDYADHAHACRTGECSRRCSFGILA